jgi:hypothetical protein
MLEPDPDRRATMAEIQQSSFFRGISREQLDMEEDADDGKPTGKRRLSHFFNEDLLKDDSKANSALSSDLVNAPVERIDHERHTVVVKGVELPTVDWFGAKYPGRRSTTSTAHKGKGKGRKSLRKQLDAELLSSPSLSSSASTTSSTTMAAPGLNLTLSQALMRKMDDDESGCPSTPQGPGSGVSESPGPSTDKVLMPVVEELPEEQEHEHEHADGQEEEERSGPRPLNAFDLINMVSGQSMNNMLLFNKGVQSQGQPSFTQFTSRLPTDVLMKRIDYVLLSIPRIRYRICLRKCQVSLVWTSPKNHRIGAHIEVYNLTNALHMVQCKRMHGSILAHHELYKRLRDDIKANERDVPIETVRARLAEWESDYPIFAEAYQQRSRNDKPAPTEVSVPTDAAVAEAAAEIHSAAPPSACPVPIGSLRAGLNTMRSLTARKPAPPPSTTSSSDDDTDNESDTSSVASPATVGNRRMDAPDVTAAMRSLRVADDTALPTGGIQAPELSRTRSNSTQPRIEGNCNGMGSSSNTLHAQVGPIIP